MADYQHHISEQRNHYARLGEYAANLWKENVMTDVIVVVGDREFKSHKAVLACHSPYFKEMLLKPSSNNVHHLETPCVTANAFSFILGYMYTGELNLTCQDIADVYNAANKLGIRQAVNKCLELITITSRTVEHSVNLYVTAKKLNIAYPIARAFKLMLQQFEVIVESKEYLNLEVDQLQDFLSADVIGTRSETVVFLAALKWLNYKFVERETHISQVMHCVRFPLMNPREVLACYHPPVLPGIVLYPPVRESLYKGTCYSTARQLGQEKMFEQLSCPPRQYQLQGEPDITWDIESLYDPEHYVEYRARHAAIAIQKTYRGYKGRKYANTLKLKKFRAAVLIQSMFRGHAARRRFYALQDEEVYPKQMQFQTDSEFVPTKPLTDTSRGKGFIFAVGGIERIVGEIRTNMVFCYSPSAKVWNEITRLPEPIRDNKIVVMNKCLYFLGGCDPRLSDDNGILPRSECYRYFLDNNQWISTASLRTGRLYHGADVLDGQIFVVGGKDDKGRCLASMEFYDPELNRWREVTPMSRGRMGIGTAVYDGKIWVAGGMAGRPKKLIVVDTVECYDPITNKWSKKQNLPTAVAFLSLVRGKSGLYAIGGAALTNKGNLQSVTDVYNYSAKNNFWKKTASLPTALHSPTACADGDDIYIFSAYAQERTKLKKPICYDSSLSMWKVVGSVPASAHGFITAVTNTSHLL